MSKIDFLENLTKSRSVISTSDELGSGLKSFLGNLDSATAAAFIKDINEGLVSALNTIGPQLLKSGGASGTRFVEDWRQITIRKFDALKDQGKITAKELSDVEKLLTGNAMEAAINTLGRTVGFNKALDNALAKGNKIDFDALKTASGLDDVDAAIIAPTLDRARRRISIVEGRAEEIALGRFIGRETGSTDPAAILAEMTRRTQIKAKELARAAGKDEKEHAAFSTQARKALLNEGRTPAEVEAELATARRRIGQRINQEYNASNGRTTPPSPRLADGPTERAEIHARGQSEDLRAEPRNQKVEENPNWWERIKNYRKTKEANNGLPKFNPGFDWFKFRSRMSSPRNWVTIKAAKARSYAVTRPIVNFLDTAMDETGIMNGLKDLDSAALKTINNGGDATKLIDDFAKNNLDALNAFSKRTRELRKHVESTYKTNAERSKDGTDNTLWHNDLTTAQKNAVIDYLKYMEAFAEDLAKGSNGNNGQQILRNIELVKEGKLDYKEVEASITGLSQSAHFANNAYIRSTGKFLDGTTASFQYKEQLIREFNEGYFNPHAHEGKPVIMSTKIRENVEKPWQDFVEKYTALNPDGTPKVTFSDNVENKEGYLGALLGIIREGNLGAEAAFSVKEQSRMIQANAKGATHFPFPEAASFAKVLNGEWGKTNGITARERFYLERALDIIRETQTNPAGFPKKTAPWHFGIPEHITQVNRYTLHKAERNEYFWDYWERHKGAKKFMPALPAWNFSIFRIEHNLRKPLAFLLGGQDVTTGKRYLFGRELKDYMSSQINWLNKGANGNPTESGFAIPRRIAARWLSGGLINDINKPSLSLYPPAWIGIKPTLLGKTALTGAAVWGVGEYTDSPFLSGLGEETAEIATYPVRFGWGAATGLTLTPWGKSSAKPAAKGGGSTAPTDKITTTDVSKLRDQAIKEIDLGDLPTDLAAIKFESGGKPKEIGRVWDTAAVPGNVDRAREYFTTTHDAYKELEAEGKRIAAWIEKNKDNPHFSKQLEAMRLLQQQHASYMEESAQIGKTAAAAGASIVKLNDEIQKQTEARDALTLLRQQRDELVGMKQGQLLVTSHLANVRAAFDKGVAIEETPEAIKARKDREAKIKKEQEEAFRTIPTLAIAKDLSKQTMDQGEEIFSKAEGHIAALKIKGGEIAARLKKAEDEKNQADVTLYKGQLEFYNKKMAEIEQSNDNVVQLQEKVKENNEKLKKLFADVSNITDEQKLSTARNIINEQRELLSKMTADTANIENTLTAVTTAYEQRKPVVAPAPVVAASPAATGSTGGGTPTAAATPQQAELNRIRSEVATSQGNNTSIVDRITAYLGGGKDNAGTQHAGINAMFDDAKEWADRVERVHNDAVGKKFPQSPESQKFLDDAKKNFADIAAARKGAQEAQEKINKMRAELATLPANDEGVARAKLLQAQMEEQANTIWYRDAQGNESGFLVTARKAHARMAKQRDENPSIIEQSNSLATGNMRESWVKAIDNGSNNGLLGDLTGNGTIKGYAERGWDALGKTADGLGAWWNNVERWAAKKGPNHQFATKAALAVGSGVVALTAWNFFSSLIKKFTGKDLNGGFTGFLVMAGAVLFAFNRAGASGDRMSAYQTTHRDGEYARLGRPDLMSSAAGGANMPTTANAAGATITPTSPNRPVLDMPAAPTPDRQAVATIINPITGLPQVPNTPSDIIALGLAPAQTGAAQGVNAKRTLVPDGTERVDVLNHSADGNVDPTLLAMASKGPAGPQSSRYVN